MMRRFALALASAVAVVLWSTVGGAAAGPLPDGGAATGVGTAVGSGGSPSHSTVTFTFPSITMVGTEAGVTDVFTLSGLTFTVAFTPGSFNCPTGVVCQVTASGPVNGSFPLTGAQGSTFTCAGNGATATETALQVGGPGVATLDVPLVCTGTGQSSGSAPLQFILVQSPGIPEGVVPQPLVVAGVFT